MKKTITIILETPRDAASLGEKIHDQLAGNKDYIENNILLNVNCDQRCVSLYITNDSKTVPDILV